MWDNSSLCGYALTEVKHVKHTEMAFAVQNACAEDSHLTAWLDTSVNIYYTKSKKKRKKKWKKETKTVDILILCGFIIQCFGEIIELSWLSVHNVPCKTLTMQYTGKRLREMSHAFTLQVLTLLFWQLSVVSCVYKWHPNKKTTVYSFFWPSV